MFKRLLLRTVTILYEYTVYTLHYNMYAYNIGICYILYRY